MEKEKIKEFVETNFRIHEDWTGKYIEADPDQVGRELPDLIEKLYDFINNTY